MGNSFIVKTKGGIKKGWDKAKQQLSIDELRFDCTESVRTIQAKPVSFGEIEVGQTLAVKASNGSLLMISKGNIVGVCETPPPSIVDGLENLGGYGVGKIDQVKMLSGLWDVAIYLEPLVRDVEM